jgi:hypothetical protein
MHRNRRRHRPFSEDRGRARPHHGLHVIVPIVVDAPNGHEQVAGFHRARIHRDSADGHRLSLIHKIRQTFHRFFSPFDAGPGGGGSSVGTPSNERACHAMFLNTGAAL